MGRRGGEEAWGGGGVGRGEGVISLYFSLHLNIFISSYHYILISLYLDNLYFDILHLKRTHLLDIFWPC